MAPYAEEAARIFWRSRRSKQSNLPTRLTQARRSLAKAGKLVLLNLPSLPTVNPRCLRCGGSVTTGLLYCARCTPSINRENMLEKAKLGRIATHSPLAEARRTATHAKQVEALRRWNPAELPKWLDEDFYRREILPRLSAFTVKAIRLAIDVSHPYAILIKRGERIPHPRHWVRLARLAGV